MKNSIVSIRRVPDYSEEAVLSGLRRCLEPLGGMGAFVKAGQRVLLKPNLLAAFVPERAVTTHPSVVKAVAMLVLEQGAQVIIGDSPGFGAPAAVMKRCGITGALSGINYEPGDFDHEFEFEEPSNRVARRINLVKALNDADVVITLPKLKTHAQMGFTGALKNQFGLVRGFQKAHYHYRMKDRKWLAALMIDINAVAKPALAVMDGIIAMEGDGPAGGDPRFLGALIAGSDITAVDTLACALIDIDVESLPLMREARERDFGATRMEDISVAGDDWEGMRQPDFRKTQELKSALRLLALPVPFLEWLRKYLSARPRIIPDLCIKCGACREGCPVDPSAINPFSDDHPVDHERCIRCYCCHEFCPVKAIELKRSILARLLAS